MERTNPARRPSWVRVLLAGFAILIALTPLAGAAQTDDGIDPASSDDAGRVGLVALRVETSGAVTTASLSTAYETFLADLQADLTTIVGQPPSDPILVRFAGALPDAGEGWTAVGTVAVVNDDATDAVVALDSFLSLSDIDARNLLRNLTARRWLASASGGAMPAPLVDGFAAYLEAPVLARQARQASLAQQAWLDGELPAWDEIVSDPDATASLDPDAAQAARLAAAAFLIERYGANVIADLARFHAGAPEADVVDAVIEVTGQPRDRLDAGWEDFIAVWFAGGWRANAFAALDLQPARDLFARGAYEAAVDRANQTLQVTTALDDRVASAEAEMLVAQGSVGMQAEALMRDAEQALAEHDYSRALTLIERAEGQYALLPEDHRPASLIETWRGMATDGMSAVERLERATTEFDDWFSMRSAREDAVEAGSVFARLGDTERLAVAEELVGDLDERFLNLVLSLGAAIVVLLGWLLVWSWNRSPGRVRWPGLADLARQEAAR
jgi:hypothetical protein